MNPLRELRGLVATPPVSVERGVVTEVQDASITVKTRYGLRTVSPAGVNNYKVGDPVRVQGNLLLGRTTPADALPSFRV